MSTLERLKSEITRSFGTKPEAVDAYFKTRAGFVRFLERCDKEDPNSKDISVRFQNNTVQLINYRGDPFFIISVIKGRHLNSNLLKEKGIDQTKATRAQIEAAMVQSDEFIEMLPDGSGGLIPNSPSVDEIHALNLSESSDS